MNIVVFRKYAYSENNFFPQLREAYLFEGVCLTTVILAPGARKGGCELPAKSHFAGIGGIGRIAGIRGIPG